MKHQIKHNLSGSVMFECDVPTNSAFDSVYLALKAAIEANINLSGADLRGADLNCANLSGVELNNVNFSGVNLSGANLIDADLTGANLTGAHLVGANLKGAVLTRACLRGAYMDGADMRHVVCDRADLRDAHLTLADLSDAFMRYTKLNGSILVNTTLVGADMRFVKFGEADVSDSKLSMIKSDFFEILLRAPHEIHGLRSTLIAGNVDGAVYEGECACLVGTIANVRGSVNYHELGNGIKPNVNRPAERWFLGIAPGDTPETSQLSRIAVEWIDEFLGLLTTAGMM